MDKIKIIIDTDIGDDADDALAICLALKSEELEVMGITTVFRNTAARAQIAVRLLQLMGRTDIPVYAGIGHPLVAEADVERCLYSFWQEWKSWSTGRTWMGWNICAGAWLRRRGT